jgi:hypothetical protein
MPVASAFPYPLVVPAVRGTARRGGALLWSDSIPPAGGPTRNIEVHLKRQMHSEFGRRGRVTDMVDGRLRGIMWEDDTSQIWDIWSQIISRWASAVGYSLCHPGLFGRRCSQPLSNVSPRHLFWAMELHYGDGARLE